MYLQFVSFLHTDMTQIVLLSNPSSCKTKTYLVYIVNITAADDLATQGARASTAMILI